jgi:ubiquinone/menaquinone biosynthesis C-methylase UbiE
MIWEDYLADRYHNNLYVNALVYMPTIKLIRRIAKKGDRLFEAGCGTGRSAMLLSDMGYRVTAFDLSLNLLERIASAANFFSTLQIVNGDISSLPFADKSFKISYSCGVLEHFDPPDILAFMTEQKRIAQYVVVDVPNNRCSVQSFGDERFYADEKWEDMFEETGLVLVHKLHRGLDNGRFVGNCSVFLLRDKNDTSSVRESIDVYDYY